MTDWSALIAQEKEKEPVKKPQVVTPGQKWSNLIATEKSKERKPAIVPVETAEDVPPIKDDVDTFLENRPAAKQATEQRAFNVAALNPEQAPQTLTQKEGEEEKKGLLLREAMTEGLKNLPSSVAKQVKSVVDAVSNPSQTWEGLKMLSKDIYKIQMGTALKDMGFDPSKVKFEEKSVLEHIEETPALDAVVDDLKKTYGTYDGFKNAIAKDPARIMVDMGSILTPAAKGVEAAAVVAKLPVVAKVAGTAAKGAALLEPTTAVTAAVKQTVKTVSELTGKKFPKLSPTGMYKSATKMSTKLSESERNKLAEVALNAGIPPTLKGLAIIDNSIQKLDSTIAGMIDAADTSGKTMPIAKLFKEFDRLKSDARLSGSATESIRAINRVKKSLQDANFSIGRGRLKPKDVQKLKQTIYKELQTHYEQVKTSPMKAQAKKAVAKASKEYLEEILPEIKALNKNDGDLIALRNAIKGPASRISNRDITSSLGTAGKASAGAIIGSQVVGPKTAAALAASGVVLGVLDDPVIKSKLAIVLKKLQKKGINISPERAIVKLGLLQVGQTSKTIEEGEK